MKKTNRFKIIIAGFIVIFFSVSSAGQVKLSNLSWLLGKWESLSGGTYTTESWERLSDNTFEGYGETINTTSIESISSETLRIVEMSGEIFYIAKVAHNQYPIAFKLTQCSDSSFVFENHEHDFPQRIEYTLSNEDQLTVNVSNTKDGFSIHFVRKKL